MTQKKLSTQAGIIIGLILCLGWLGICIVHKNNHKLNEFVVREYLRDANNLIDTELEKKEEDGLEWIKNLPLHQDHETTYDIEGAYACMDRFLIEHPDAQGIVLGMEMDLTDHNGEFFPCCIRNGMQIVHDSLGAGRQNLLQHYQSDWYVRTLTSKNARWSKAFQNENAGLTKCFCIPLTSTKGNVYGVAGIMYPFKPIEDKLLEISPSSQARICLTEEDKTIVVNSQEKPRGETIFGLMERESWEFDINAFDNLDWEKEGTMDYEMDGKNKHFFFRTNERSRLTIILDAAF